MATKRRLVLPQISGIVPGSLAGTVGVINVPLGYRYHKFDIVYVDGGAAPLDIDAILGDIVLYKNTTDFRTHTSVELEHLNTLNGAEYGYQQVGAGAAMRQTQTIFMAEPWRKDKADTDYMAVSADAANGWNTFQIKITLIAAMPATGSIRVYARVDDPIKPPAGGQSIKKVYRQQIPVAGSTADVTTIDAKDAIQTICLKHPSGAGYINKATLKLNGVLILEDQNALDNQADLTGLGLTPGAGTTLGSFGYDIVLDADDPLGSALVAEKQAVWMQLAFTTTATGSTAAAASGSVVALIERIGAI